jgi:hypothetical protein
MSVVLAESDLSRGSHANWHMAGISYRPLARFHHSLPYPFFVMVLLCPSALTPVRARRSIGERSSLRPILWYVASSECSSIPSLYCCHSFSFHSSGLGLRGVMPPFLRPSFPSFHSVELCALSIGVSLTSNVFPPDCALAPAASTVTKV